MSRLYDELLAHPLSQGIGKGSLPFAGAVAIDVENVAAYMAASGSDEYPDWEFPNLAPPWIHAFFEYRTPPPAVGPENRGIVDRYGILMMVYDRHVERVRDRIGWWDDDGEPRWAILFHSIMATGRLRLYVQTAGVQVDEQGALLRTPEGWVKVMKLGPAEDDLGLPCELDPVLLAISLSHCKNVELRAVDPDPKRLRSARKRGRPLNRYHVLEIDPMRKVLRDEGRSDDVGLPQALHICRGHFKDYRERGLFGSEKHRGVYWWPQTLKGSPKVGTVTKDYAVEPPRVD